SLEFPPPPGLDRGLAGGHPPSPCRQPARRDPTSGKCRGTRLPFPLWPPSTCVLAIRRASIHTGSFPAHGGAHASNPIRCHSRPASPFRTTSSSALRRPCPECRRAGRSPSIPNRLPAVIFPGTGHPPGRLVVFARTHYRTRRTPSLRRGSRLGPSSSQSR